MLHELQLVYPIKNRKTVFPDELVYYRGAIIERTVINKQEA